MVNNSVCLFIIGEDSRIFITTQGGVTIRNNFVPAYRLVSPAKRVTLSNVSLCLPHEIVEKELKSVGLKMVYRINFIRAGIAQEKYWHVHSFRRQVYIVFDKEEKLTHSLFNSV